MHRVGQVEKVKGALPAAEEAPALEPAEEEKPPQADFVDHEKPFIDPDLSIRELRARLLSYGLSTIGLKSELRTRLEYALEHERSQHQSWDAEAKAWK